MADADTIHELMRRSLEHVFTQTATANLFGLGPERALDAYRRLLAPGTSPCVYIEFPLLGPASYDVFVGPYGECLKPGTHLPADSQPACQAAWDWASTSGQKTGVDLLFELDADAPEGQHAGVYCRHMGNLDAADRFLQAIGEGWRFPDYLNVVRRLPEGWKPVFVAVFFGRPGTPTRIELYPSAREFTRVVHEPGYLRACLDNVGFRAYDDQMTEGSGRPLRSDAPPPSSSTSSQTAPWEARSPLPSSSKDAEAASASSSRTRAPSGACAVPSSAWASPTAAGDRPSSFSSRPSGSRACATGPAG